MILFEITLMLLGIAVLMLQLARHLRLPYPSLLALVGGCVAALPFAPHIQIDPQLALALFVAPAVMDTAFDMPPREWLRNWLPLVSLAVILVLLTTVVVAWVGVRLAGLPLAAALALGAIVAPPDAAAAAALLREFNLPRRMMAVLQGESLLNDAVALLAFSMAVTAATAGAASWGPLLPRLLVAVPGGAIVGVLIGVLGTRWVSRLSGTLASIPSQFLLTYGTWVIAARLQLSPIMAVIALAAVAARVGPGRTNARDRINSNAVWTTIVFVLNVLAFLLMGLQARVILTQLHGTALTQALTLAAVVLATVIAVRFGWVMLYGFVMRRFWAFFEAKVPGAVVPQVRAGILVSWCGMRGLVTLATAFALPAEFPGRDLIVLSAFSVVLGTLILQGFSMRPLIAVLHLTSDSSLDDDVNTARKAMLRAAVDRLAGQSGEQAAAVAAEYRAALAQSKDHARPVTRYDQLRLAGIAAERELLAQWRQEARLLDDAYHILEDELDRAELQAAAHESSWLGG